MKLKSLLCSVALVLGANANAAVIINEIDYDMVGTDNAEFIELYNNGSITVDISGYVVVLFNGATAAGAVYAPITVIPASTTLAAGAYYVIASTNVSPRNQSFPGTTDQVQNGAPDAIGLYSGGTFTVGNPATTNSGLLVDGINYEATPDATNYPGFATLSTAFADSNTLNYSIGRDDTGAWNLLASPTPGAANALAVPEPQIPVLLGAVGLLGLFRRRR